MGHQPGFPCVNTDINHAGRCSTPVIPPPADLDHTRYFEVAGNFWRTNDTAAPGWQVEYQRQNGEWETDRSYPTEWMFLDDVAGQWRQVTAEEVPHAGPDPEAA